VALRVVFMGTPEFSVPTLARIAQEGHEIAAVYTRAPQPAGRGMSEQPSPVNEKARKLGVPVIMPKTLRIPAAEELFASHRADVAVVVAYGLILPKAILEAPRFGCLNLHASALPRWRGAAPIQRALMAGDAESAAMVMRMEEGLDTGPVCLAEHIPIGPDENFSSLHDRLAERGAELMARALEKLEDGALTCEPQSADGATYAKKIGKDETRIDWTRPAADIHNQVRALSPVPGAWAEFPLNGKPQRVRILGASTAAGLGMPGQVLDVHPLRVACGEGALELLDLQRAGKKPVSASEFLRGAGLKVGDLLR
jgi:methionyl-tRNA formyltransferase